MKERNPHKWLFAYLKKTYSDDEEISEARKALIKDYSGNKTESLKTLYEQYPAAYRKMKGAIEKTTNASNSRPNKQRRKLLALVYKFCKTQGYKYTQADVLKIACKSCGVSQLKQATEQKVIAAIKSFEAGEANAWATSELNRIAKEFNNLKTV